MQLHLVIIDSYITIPSKISVHCDFDEYMISTAEMPNTTLYKPICYHMSHDRIQLSRALERYDAALQSDLVEPKAYGWDD